MSYSCKTKITTANSFAPYEKKISICLTPNGFSFSEATVNGKLLAFGEAEGLHAQTMTGVVADVKAFFSSFGIQPFGYSVLELIAVSNESVWVPDELYLAGNNRQYLRLVGGKSATTIATTCKSIGSTAVYGVNDMLTTAFKVAIPGLVLMNQHVKLTSAELCRRSSNHPVVLLYRRNGYIDIAAYREGRYRYSNSLPVSNDKDALFHTLEMVKLYDMEDPATEMLLCGDVDRDSFAMFRPYFPKITLFSGFFTADSAFAKLHTYRYVYVLI